MSLRDGTKKMSKSDPSDMSRINLSDDADTIATKIRKARTDAEPLPETVAGLAGRPEAANLVNIYAALANEDAKAVLAEFAGKNFSEFKPRLAELAGAELTPITRRIRELTADPAEIDRLLGRGADKAAAIAEPILARTYEIVGLVR
jgi:tryptophanyl-tRNA synthetase